MMFRVFFFFLFLLAPLPVAFASEHYSLAPTKVSDAEISMKFTDFNLVFRNGSNLRKEELKVFPKELQNYLLVRSDWHKEEIRASSIGISRGRFLVSVTFPSIDGYWSKAALLTLKGKTVSPTQGLSWRPLFLPKLEEWGEGWAISVSGSHPNLEWKEDLEAVQTTYCSDVVNDSCIRHTTKLFRNRHVLVLVEVDTSRRGHNWQVFWEKGRWLPKAPEADLP
ncbi:hypothetical protein ABLO27_02765 [Roseibium sp. SCPC15]|uniref:hypothetical protein n=1 Tax=Roseibium sp. SCP15 TaxID=3141376 RepID=UPI00333D5EE7